jgi:hypothetical protein
VKLTPKNVSSASIADHFTIALLTFGIAAELLSAAAILLPHGRIGYLSVLRPEAAEHWLRVIVEATHQT